MQNYEKSIPYILVTENIVSDNAESWGEKIRDVFDSEKGITIDCSGASFFSSAGLRILLSLQKQMKDGKKICLINVTHELMEILETTGLSTLMDAKLEAKKISIEGMKPFATGGTGECFRLDSDRILKLYYESTPDEVIEKEKMSAKMALISGIPTAISYDIVQVDSRKGIVYELLQAKTLAQQIIEQPENIGELGRDYAKLAKQIHETEGDSANFPKWTETFRNVLKNADFSEKINSNINELLDKMDNYTTYVHGDFNPNNIMISENEMMLIDMADFSIGSPLYDLSTIYFTLCYMIEGKADEEIYPFTGMTCKMQHELWNVFVQEYFGVKSEEEALTISEEARLIKKLTVLKGFVLSLRWQNAFPKEDEERFKNDVELYFK